MKGIVFTEFLDFVQALDGWDMVDDIIDDACLPHDGVYTAVGTYPFVEMQRLATALAIRKKTGLSDLMMTFGDHLCGRFIVKYPAFFDAQSTLFDFIESVDRYIHVEVRKLYPDAELPTFSTQSRHRDCLVIDYTSCRQLETLAEGMIRTAADHYGEPITIQRSGIEIDGTRSVRFRLERVA